MEPFTDGVGLTADTIRSPSRRRRELASLSRQLFVGGPWLRRRLQHFRPYICPFESVIDHVRDGARVLDVGCGSGLFLGLLAARGKSIDGIGFDTSEGAIKAAREMADKAQAVWRGSSLRFIRLDVGAPWPAGPFDVVSVIDVMHHIPPAAQHRLFRDAANAVAPHGLLVYKDMCRRPAWRALANRLHDLLLARQWIHYLPVESAERWAWELGMQLENAARIDLLWYGHELRIFRKCGN